MFSHNDICPWGLWTPFQKKPKNLLFFEYFWLLIHWTQIYLLSKMRLYSTVGLFSVANVLILYFHILQGSFKVLNISNFCICQNYYHYCVLQYVPLSENFLNILVAELVVELLTNSENFSSFSRIKAIHLYKNP